MTFMRAQTQGRRLLRLWFKPAWTRLSPPSPTPNKRWQPFVVAIEAVEVAAEIGEVVVAANVEEEAAPRTVVRPVVPVVEVVVTGVPAILMGRQIKPAGCTGNSGSPRTFVWILLSVPGRTFLLQDLNPTNETLTSSTQK